MDKWIRHLDRLMDTRAPMAAGIPTVRAMEVVIFPFLLFLPISNKVARWFSIGRLSSWKSTSTSWCKSTMSCESIYKYKLFSTVTPSISMHELHWWVSSSNDQFAASRTTLETNLHYISTKSKSWTDSLYTWLSKMPRVIVILFETLM